MSLPNLKHLQYLLALHKHQHFQRAAQASFVSQSTLSSAIIKLEEQLCCQLIERNHKAFIFTSQGEKVVELAKQLLVSANELVDYAQQQGKPNSGSIRIGCIPTMAPFLLTDLVKHCQKELPNLSLYLREDTTENLIMQLAQGDIDTVILALPIANHAFIEKSLGKDRLYVAGNSDLVSAFSAKQDYQLLPEKSVFLLSQEHCLTEHTLSACQLTDQSRINDFSASSLATLVQMTAYHNGITFLPEMAINKKLGQDQGLTMAKLPSNFYREIGMLWRPTSMRKQTFMQIAAIVESLLP
jgi:LysR family hydrogen peroxide-inducible transcriptional activator